MLLKLPFWLFPWTCAKLGRRVVDLVPQQNLLVVGVKGEGVKPPFFPSETLVRMNPWNGGDGELVNQPRKCRRVRRDLEILEEDLELFWRRGLRNLRG